MVQSLAIKGLQIFPVEDIRVAVHVLQTLSLIVWGVSIVLLRRATGRHLGPVQGDAVGLVLLGLPHAA